MQQGALAQQEAPAQQRMAVEANLRFDGYRPADLDRQRLAAAGSCSSDAPAHQGAPAQQGALAQQEALALAVVGGCARVQPTEACGEELVEDVGQVMSRL